jgi:hypothetical protein
MILRHTKKSDQIKDKTIVGDIALWAILIGVPALILFEVLSVVAWLGR